MMSNIPDERPTKREAPSNSSTPPTPSSAQRKAKPPMQTETRRPVPPTKPTEPIDAKKMSTRELAKFIVTDFFGPFVSFFLKFRTDPKDIPITTMEEFEAREPSPNKSSEDSPHHTVSSPEWE